MIRLGKDQLRMLIVLASPTCLCLTPGRSEMGLVKRGLLRIDYGPKGNSAAVCITAAGLRALADHMEAGHVESAIEAMRREAAARKKKASAQ